MRMIAPRTGAHEITLAEEQPEYMPLTAAVYHHAEMQSPVLLTRWTFTPEERRRIAKGEDVYIGVLTFGKPLQPLLVQCGPEGWEAPAGTTRDA